MIYLNNGPTICLVKTGKTTYLQNSENKWIHACSNCLEYVSKLASFFIYYVYILIKQKVCRAGGGDAMVWRWP